MQSKAQEKELRAQLHKTESEKVRLEQAVTTTMKSMEADSAQRDQLLEKLRRDLSSAQIQSASEIAALTTLNKQLQADVARLTPLTPQG